MTPDKRTAILNATLKLVSEQGFHGTSMAMIAREAGVSAGIIYHYFENKDALLEDLYRAIKAELVAAVLRDFSDDLPLRERFRVFWLNVLHYYIRHPAETAFVEQFANSPYLSPELETEYMEQLAPVMAFMEYAMHEGVIKPMPREMVATFTYDVAVSLAKKHVAGALILDDAAKELAVDACWDAIKR